MREQASAQSWQGWSSSLGAAEKQFKGREAGQKRGMLAQGANHSNYACVTAITNWGIGQKMKLETKDQILLSATAVWAQGSQLRVQVRAQFG